MTLFEAGSNPTTAATVLGTATTDSTTGAFTISGAAPTPGAFLYVVVSGGSSISGGAANSASVLMTTLGPVTSVPSGGISVTVNELTTVASSYALAQFFYSETDLRDSTTPELSNAFAAIPNLVDTATGTAGVAISSTTPDNSTSLQRMNTLASAMANCVQSASSTSTACTNLCSAALPLTCDTLAAAQAVAHQPGLSTLFGSTGIQAIAASTQLPAFSPVLIADPTDWTLSLAFDGGGAFPAPDAIAIDGKGNVWVTDSSSGALTELASNGAPIALPTPTPSVIIPVQLTFDSTGALWIRDGEGGQLVKYDPATGTTPVTIPFVGTGGFAVDGSNNLFVTDNSNSLLDEYTSSGTMVGSAISGNGLLSPGPVVVDGGGNVWVANALNLANPTAPSTLSEFTSAGAAATGSPFSDPSLSNPNAMAIGPQPTATAGGMIWVTDGGAGFVSSSTATPAVTIADISTSPPTFSAISTGGGLNLPLAVAVDGAGNGWITDNVSPGAISEIDSFATPLSPSTGFTGPGLSNPDAIAIDGAGNVWVGSSGSGLVTEFIGAALPIVPPLVTQPVPGGVQPPPA